MGKNFDYQKQIEHQFDNFCKTVLRNYARDLYEQNNRRNEYLVSLESLSLAELSKISFFDLYDSDYLWFVVKGYEIKIRDIWLAQAIGALTQPKQDIILLSYFLEMKSKDIAILMNLAESTVHYHKKRALKELRKFIEEHTNEE